MSPKNYTVVHEAADRFHVHDGESQFAVAKAGLSPATIKRIQSFAKGGEVLHAFDGVEVPGQAQIVPPAPPSSDATISLMPPDTGRAPLSPDELPPRLSTSGGPEGPLLPPTLIPVPSTVPQSVAGMLDRVERHEPTQYGPDAHIPTRPITNASKERGETKPGPSAGGASYVPGPNQREYGEFKKAEAGASAEEQAAITQQGEVARAKAKEESDIRKQQMIDEATFSARQQKMTADYQADRARRLDEYGALVDKYADAKIDPQRFWASRNTGEKVLAGIGLLLGGIGAGATGGINRSIEVIDGAINRDIDAQKADIEKTGKQLGLKQNLLAIMKGNYEDDATALAAAKASMRQNAINQIEEMAARYGGSDKAAQLGQLAAGLRAGHARDQQTVSMQMDAAARESAVKNHELKIQDERNDILRERALAKAKAGNPLTANALDALKEMRAQFDKVGKSTYAGAGFFGGTESSKFTAEQKNSAILIASAMRPGGKPVRSIDEAMKIIHETLPSASTSKAGGGPMFDAAEKAIMRAGSIPAQGGGGLSAEDIE